MVEITLDLVYYKENCLTKYKELKQEENIPRDYPKTFVEHGEKV